MKKNRIDFRKAAIILLMGVLSFGTCITAYAASAADKESIRESAGYDSGEKESGAEDGTAGTYNTAEPETGSPEGEVTDGTKGALLLTLKTEKPVLLETALKSVDIPTSSGIDDIEVSDETLLKVLTCGEALEDASLSETVKSAIRSQLEKKLISQNSRLLVATDAFTKEEQIYLTCGGKRYEIEVQAFRIEYDNRVGDNAYWYFEDGVLTIKGTGPTWDFRTSDKKRPGFYDLAGEIRKVTVEEGITAAGNYVFEDCGIKEISLPSTLERIGYGAFQSCTVLKDLQLPEKLRIIGPFAFADCTSLKTLHIPESVEQMGDHMFYDCHGLEELTIPFVGGSESATGKDALFGYLFKNDRNGATTLNTTQYYGSSKTSRCFIPQKLNKVTVLRGELKYGAFSGIPTSSFREGMTIVLGDGVSKIGEYAFRDAKGIVQVVIGSGVKDIGEKAFYGCTGIAGMTIPDTVESIGAGALCDCTGLKELTIPFTGASRDATNEKSLYGYVFGYGDYKGNTVVTQTYYKKSVGYGYHDVTFRIPTSLIKVVLTGDKVGYGAFKNCSMLKTAELKGNPTELGDNVFDHCQALENVNIPESVRNIGSSAFHTCTALETVSLPRGLTSISSFMFYKCTALTSVNIPEGVTNVGNDAFYGCKSLKEMELPDGVTTIGEAVFESCTNMEAFHWPEKLTRIGERAFYNCEKLTSVSFHEGLTSIGMQAFDYCSGIKEMLIPKSVTSIGQLALGLEVDDVKHKYVPIPDFVIYSYWYSEAHNYADKNQINFIPLDMMPVSLDPQGGKVNPERIMVVFGEPYGELPVPVLAGNTFSGWYSEDGVQYTAASVTRWETTPKVLYARWGATEYTVTFNTFGIGNTPAPVTVSHGAKISEPELTGITGYNFSGWYTDAECRTAKYDFNSTVKESFTLYAKLTKTSGKENISRCTVQLEQTEYEYTGTPRCPGVIVSFYGTTLVQNQDYTLIYLRNINVGTAYVRITGIGNYTGSVDVPFSIVKAANVITADDQTLQVSTCCCRCFCLNIKRYDNAELTCISDNPRITVTNSGHVTIPSNYGGVAVITIYAKETTRYNAAEKEITITVEKLNNSITVQDVTCNYSKDSSQTVKVSATALGNAPLHYSVSKTGFTVDDFGRVTIPAGFTGNVKVDINAEETDVYKAADTTATITVKYVDSVQRKIDQIVYSAPVQRVFLYYQVQQRDQHVQISYWGNSGPVTFESNNTKYVTVDSSGYVTVKKGTPKGSYIVDVIAGGEKYNIAKSQLNIRVN